MEIEKFVTFYCSTCQVTRRVRADIKSPVCTCGANLTPQRQGPVESETIRDLRLAGGIGDDVLRSGREMLKT